MKHSTSYKWAAGIAVLMLLSMSVNAQLVNCNAFLQGNYIEVGINTLGSYGSSTAAPAGYHPRGGTGVYNTCTATTGPSNTNLGFVADPDKDGWTIGTPAYMGDYFLPGTPYEGWMIEINGTRFSQNNGQTTSLGSITSVTNSGKIRSATWQGTYSGLSIKQVTSFDTANLYFTGNVTLKNTTGATLNNVYYVRGVDPDNEEPITGNFTTNNSIVYNLPNSLGATLVAGVGQTYNAYLGLGTLDPRAKAYITQSWPPSISLASIYAGGASGYTYSGSNVGDYGIGIVFNIGSLAPGDSTNFVFTYILKGSDFLNALLATSSNWSATGDVAFSHKSKDTANICQFSTTTVTINNPTPHTYTWTSLTGETLSATTGSSVTLNTGNTLIRLMAIGSSAGYPDDTTYINLNPLYSTPSTPTASNSGPVCQGSTLNLSASGGGTGVTYKWSGPTSFSSTLQNPSITNVQPGASGVYQVYAMMGACPSASPATTTVSINPSPNVTVDYPVSVCSGTPTTLTASGASTYTWAGPRLSATTGTSVVASPTVASTYTITCTDALGCTRTTTFSINMSTTISAMSGSSTVCANSTITLTDNTINGSWSSSNPAVATIYPIGIGLVTGVSAGTAMISYSAPTYCGVATKIITVTAAPSVSPITGNMNIFAGYATTLSSTTTGGVWTSGNTAVATVNSAGIVTGVSAGFANITYSVTSGCTGRAAATVAVYNCGTDAILNFGYTGAPQSWTVPAGVTSVNVTLTGAAGGAAYYDATYGNHAGRGGKVTGTLAVTPGQVFNVYVGGKGGDFVGASQRSQPGYNGGGYGGYYYGGGGGGASDIRIGGSGLSDRIVVAGGGGANGYGYSGSGNGGDGGNLVGGTGGFYPIYPAGSASGGTQSAGGTAGYYASGSGPSYANYYGFDGSLGQGGDGAFYEGGAGGGGYYGGGGGGYLGGGGGGSSYAGTLLSSVAMTSGFNTGNGSVQITFSASNITINTQPASTTVCEGTGASFSIAASMIPLPNDLSYQWQVNSGAGFTDIVGATSTTYSLTPAASQNGEQYRAVVTGACAQTTASDAATLTVNAAPVVTCSGNITTGNDEGLCSATVTYSATTTGTTPAITYSQNSGTSFPVGTTTVTVNATNACGSSSCSFDITVNDTENPSITAPDNITVSANSGSCVATGYTPGSAVTSDNCGVASVTNDDAGSYAVGVHTITWTVTDVHGHATTAMQTITVVDDQYPVAICQNYTLNLSGGTGTITADDIDNGSYDNCSIASMTVSPSTFTCADAGTHTVTLTVTDASGNVSTCTSTVTVQYQPSATITVTPANTTYTGGNANTIYLGYGPQSATLTANASGGSGFTYSWTPGTALSCTDCVNPVFAPTSAGAYVYTVTVTNSNGCSTTATVTLCVIDARDAEHSNKVIICHVPPGNPSNPQTLSISISAVPTHIGSHAGDRLGSCSSECGAAAKMAPQDAQLLNDGEFSMLVYPNPFNTEIHVDIEGKAGTPASITIFDMTGRIIEYKADQSISSSIIVGQQLPSGVYILEVNQNGVSKKVKITKL